MNRFITFLSIGAIMVLFSCDPPKPVTHPQTASVKAPEPPPKDPYVPFTRELFDKLTANKIDIKRVQYYIDQQLVLTRFLDNDQIDVKDGVIKFSNGKYINEIIIPQYTPVVCDVIEGDGLRVKAENGGNTLKFLNSKQYSPTNFIFNPDKWNKDGSCEVNYDNNKYIVTCPTCSTSNPNEAKLVAKQKDMDNKTRSTRTTPGVTVLPGSTINGN